MTKNTSQIDPGILEMLEFLGGDDPGFVNDLISLFIDEGDKEMNKMRNAVQNNDAEALFQAAHSFKSASANIGAMELSNLSETVELTGKSGDMSQASELFSKLEAEFEQTKIGLQQLEF